MTAPGDRPPKNGAPENETVGGAEAGANAQGPTRQRVARQRVAPQRVAKVIARRSAHSRRDAERLIGEGRVTMAGEKVFSPALDIDPDADIAIDGKALAKAHATRLFRFHKPAGTVTTSRDPAGRTTIFDTMPKGLPRLVSVGRLDLNSEGLLLLTNDGDLARHMELPATGWARRYRVRVHGRVDPAALAALHQGVVVDGVAYGPITAAPEGGGAGSNRWLWVTLREGKNREIRKVMAHLGLTVTRLIRTGYGPFELRDLPKGALDEVPPSRISALTGTGPTPARLGWARAKPKAKRRTPKPTQGRGGAKPVRPGGKTGGKKRP